MTLKIPSSIGGKDSKKAYEKIVNAIPEQEIPSPNTNSSTNIDSNLSTDDFIYVPSINLYVAKQRTLLNSNWNECQEVLHKENSKILTIPEFKEFLKYSKTNFPDIYNEITEVRDPWRAEWLDADFKVEKKDLMVYSHIFDNGKIIKKKQKLDSNTLMLDKTPGISLDDWLKDSTNQGLPKENILDGDLYYWAPMKDNNSVGRFDANSDGANLICNRDPSGQYDYLGVRAVKLALGL